MILILDSGFCVLKGFFDLKERGVYAMATIKKGDIGLGELKETQ